ncbi:MAG TPA: DNA methyltransferase [Niabella sp.]|nr:DNA methyltransferase [Niabella sp.]
MTQIKHAINEEYKSEVFLMDCMEGMKQYPDKYWDLAVVDPPFGIGAENHAGNVKNGWTQWEKKKWDKNIPESEYFIELLRVSKNQIVWGGNYMTDFLPPKMCWLIWDKGQRDFSLADGEMAWTSFDKAMRIKTIHRATANQESKIHPTQKPVQLYDWIFKNYATEGQKILDTHLGSQSSRISANKNKLHFTGFELDPDYFRDGNKRYEDFVSQLTLF